MEFLKIISIVILFISAIGFIFIEGTLYGMGYIVGLSSVKLGKENDCINNVINNKGVDIIIRFGAKRGVDTELKRRDVL